MWDKGRDILRTCLLSGIGRDPEFKCSKKPGSFLSKPPPQNRLRVEDEFLSTSQLERSIQEQLYFNSCSACCTQRAGKTFLDLLQPLCSFKHTSCPMVFQLHSGFAPVQHKRNLNRASFSPSVSALQYFSSKCMILFSSCQEPNISIKLEMK